MTKAREIRVCFDANAIHNDSPLYLMAQGVKELINRHSSHSDVALSWYIPKMVRGEREYRMQAAADKLLPHIEQMEKLLGHNLNITRGNVHEQVTKRIENELVAEGVEQLGCDWRRVEWDRVFTDSSNRRPPFERGLGDKEKGFRDLVIGETFLQLVEDSPNSKKVDIVLVTNDRLLIEMVQNRVQGRENVRVLPDIASLEEYINTLASEATEEYVESLRDAAEHLFFESETQKGIYFSDEVISKVAAHLTTLQSDVPEGAVRVEVEQVIIWPPNFVAKAKQRVTWVSRITVELKAVRDELYPEAGSLIRAALTGHKRVMNLGIGDQSISGVEGPGLLKLATTPKPEPVSIGKLLSESISIGKPAESSENVWKKREVVAYKGEAVIEVRWAVTVTKKGRLTHTTIVDSTVTKAEWTKEP